MTTNSQMLVGNVSYPPLASHPKFQALLANGTYIQTYGDTQLFIKKANSGEMVLPAWEISMFPEKETFYLLDWIKIPDVRLKVVAGTTSNPNKEVIKTLIRFFENEDEKEKLASFLDEEEQQLCLFRHYHQRVALRVGGSHLSEDDFEKILDHTIHVFNQQENNRNFTSLATKRKGKYGDIALIWMGDIHASTIQRFQILCQQMMGNGGFYRPEELKNETKKQGQ